MASESLGECGCGPEAVVTGSSGGRLRARLGVRYCLLTSRVLGGGPGRGKWGSQWVTAG